MGRFSTPVCINGWIERPINRLPDHKVYVLECLIDADDYAPIELDTALTNAANAGVDVLPSGIGPNGSAYFVGDTEPQEFDKFIRKFERRFATIPGNYTSFGGSRSFPFPAYADVVAKTPESELGALWEYLTVRTQNTNPGPVWIDHSFFLVGSIPTLPSVFKVTLDGAESEFVTNGGSGTFNGTALNGDSVNDSYSVSASSPTKAEYLTSISNGDFLNVDVQLNEYLGNILHLETYKMKAQ